MVTRYARIVGLILLAVGLLGFFPALNPGHALFGIFQVDTVQNMLHMVSGLTLLAVGFAGGTEFCRRVILAFTALYGMIVVLGFLVPEAVDMNMADNLLHLTFVSASLMLALPNEQASLRH